MHHVINLLAAACDKVACARKGSMAPRVSSLSSCCLVFQVGGLVACPAVRNVYHAW